MSSRRKRRKHVSKAKKIFSRGVMTGSTVTLATLGLTNCTEGGGGSVDPPPPPFAVCKDVNLGQNLHGAASVQDSTLSVRLSTDGVPVDTLFVTNVTGATLDSLDTGGLLRLDFTLDADTTSVVTFTVNGTFLLRAGPCDFSRTFTATIDKGLVQLTQGHTTPAFDIGRDFRIELVERNGLSVRLRAAGAVDLPVQWSVTAGAFEARDHAEIVWQLPSERGFYQVELFVDRGARGFGFDALSLEVS
jgi:hypothetical protein